MANPHKFYLAHMHKKSGFRGSWDPARLLRIGYVGKLDKYGVFTVYTSLEKEGIIPQVDTGSSESSMDYTSTDSVNISFKAAGSAPETGSVLKDVEAGVTIEFNNERGVIFQASGCKTHQIVNMAEIEKKILEKFDANNWSQDWLVVTHLKEADTATVIISNSSNGKLELKASGGVGAGSLKLADASLGLTVAREQGSSMKFIAQKGLTPLYRVMGLHHPWFKDWKLIPKGKGAQGLSTQDYDPKIEDVDIDED